MVGTASYLLQRNRYLMIGDGVSRNGNELVFAVFILQPARKNKL